MDLKPPHLVIALRIASDGLKTSSLRDCQYDLLLLVIQVFDLAIYSIQVGYAFIPYHKLHISFRIDVKAKIHGPGEVLNSIERLECTI